MAAEKSGIKLFIYGIILIILLFAFTRVITLSGGKLFYLELLFFLFLLILSLIGFIGYKSAWGERVLFFCFLFSLGNLVLVWYFLGYLYVVLFVLALFGFLLSIPKKSTPSRKVKYPISSEPHSEIFDPVEPVVKEVKEVKVVKEAKKEAKKEVKAKHSPGKYVASSRSNIYHEPKCDWAKKISKQRMVWFKEKNDAWEKGYKAHSCVE